MRLVKRILAAILTMVLLLTVGPFEAKAYAGNAGTVQDFFNMGGRIPNVDYTRIPILTAKGSDLKIPINISIGTLDFRTYLQFGKTLSREEQDAIIKGCMLECELTSDKLSEGYNMINQAKKNLGFDPKIIWTIAHNAATSILPNSMGTVYSIELGTALVGEGIESDSEMRSDVVIGTTVGTLIGMGFEGPVGFALSVLAASGKDIAKEAIRLLKENEIAQRALEYEVLFEQFYSLCNDKITEAMTGGKGWHITGKGKKKLAITAFGSNVTQYWNIGFDLVKVPGGDASPLNWNGTYEGSVYINIDHDTSKMDENFVQNVLLEYELFEKLKGMYSFYDKSDVNSEMWKHLRCDNVKLVIDLPVNEAGIPQTKGVGSLLAETSLADFEDRSGFFAIEKIRMNPKVLESALGENSDGDWSNAAANGGQSNMFYIVGDMSSNYKHPVYMFVKADLDNEIIAHYGNFALIGNEQNTFGTIMASDTFVYKELYDGYLTVSYGWRGWD